MKKLIAPVPQPAAAPSPPRRMPGRLLEPLDDVVTQILGAPLKMRLEMRYPEEGPAYPVVVDIERPRGVTAGQIERLQRGFEAVMAPATSEQIARWLGALAALTVPRPGSSEDMTVRLTALRKHLEQYPADAVRSALREPWKWFPTWAELHERLERRVQARRAQASAIARWRPWSRDDELAHLDARWREAHFDSRYFRKSDPERAERAAAAAAAIEARLKELKAKEAEDE